MLPTAAASQTGAHMHKDVGLMIAAAALVLVAGYFLTGRKAAAVSTAQPGGSPDSILGGIWVVPGSQQDKMLAAQNAGF